MKSEGQDEPVDAIKNSADEDPEGYSTILDAPLCNGGLVSSIRTIRERPDVNKVSMIFERGSGGREVFILSKTALA
jgi:hypothetical protein